MENKPLTRIGRWNIYTYIFIGVISIINTAIFTHTVSKIYKPRETVRCGVYLPYSRRIIIHGDTEGMRALITYDGKEEEMTFIEDAGRYATFQVPTWASAGKFIVQAIGKNGIKSDPKLFSGIERKVNEKEI